jgi:hypothetical protein
LEPSWIVGRRRKTSSDGFALCRRDRVFAVDQFDVVKTGRTPQPAPKPGSASAARWLGGEIS